MQRVVGNLTWHTAHVTTHPSGAWTIPHAFLMLTVCPLNAHLPLSVHPPDGLLWFPFEKVALNAHLPVPVDTHFISHE